MVLAEIALIVVGFAALTCLKPTERQKQRAENGYNGHRLCEQLAALERAGVRRSR